MFLRISNWIRILHSKSVLTKFFFFTSPSPLNTKSNFRGRDEVYNGWILRSIYSHSQIFGFLKRWLAQNCALKSQRFTCRTWTKKFSNIKFIELIIIINLNFQWQRKSRFFKKIKIAKRNFKINFNGNSEWSLPFPGSFPSTAPTHVRFKCFRTIYIKQKNLFFFVV